MAWYTFLLVNHNVPLLVNEQIFVESLLSPTMLGFLHSLPSCE